MIQTTDKIYVAGHRGMVGQRGSASVFFGKFLYLSQGMPSAYA